MLLTVSIAVPDAHAQQATPITVRTVGVGMGGAASTNVAPGSLITISGTNLAAAGANLGSFMGAQLPTSLGGVQVTIGGRLAPLFTVSPTAIVAQVPYEVARGPQPLVVSNAGASSAAFSVNVAGVAPALYSMGTATVVLKAADYSLVGAANPAQPGETLVLYATGLGQTTPVQQTGVIASATALSNTTPVTVTIGGQAAEVLYSVAAPGLVGLSQVAVRAPAGPLGTVPIVLSTGGANTAPATTVVGTLRAARLDPEVQAVFERFQALGPRPLETLTPQQARMQPSFADAVRALLQAQGRSTAPEPVGRVEDRMIPGGAGMIPARIYAPQGAGPFPIIVYFHGGGFVIATVDTYDASARALANAANAIVVSVEYRKAPENKFPAQVEDAYAATQWAFTNGTTIGGRADRVAVAGESAGGNLATVVCMLARDRNGRMPLHQALVYPVTNLATESRSYEENANAPFLTRNALLWFGGHYLRTMDDARNPQASPALGNVQGLPPATLITAGFDPLRDEGALYADKLRMAGVAVDYRNYEAEAHEFFGMGAVVEAARMAVQRVGTNLRTALAQ